MGISNVQRPQIQRIVVDNATNAYNLDGQPASNYATTGENTFTGDQTISGSLNVSGSINGTILSASYALTASYALNGGSGGSGSSFPYTGSAIISGSLTVTGSIISTTGFTGSLFGTSSYALTASYIITADPIIKSGEVPTSSFSGNPKISAVTFSIPFPNNDYSINITGRDSRVWIVQSKTANGFTINSNSRKGLDDSVYWTATAFKS